MICVGNLQNYSSILPPDSAFVGDVRLSIAAPAYNEAAGIRSVVENWLEFLRHNPLVREFEIVVCNDGSNDATRAILDSLSIYNAEVRPIHFAHNEGPAVALAAAIAATRFDWVLIIDSDGQFPVERLSSMLEATRRQHSPAAIGIRNKKDVLFARFGTWASGLFCNLAHGSRMRDFNSAFKLIWGPLLRTIPLEAKGMNYSTELTSRLLESGINIAEVEIEHHPRTSGISSTKLFRCSIHRFIFVIYIYFRQFMLRCGILKRRFIVYQ